MSAMHVLFVHQNFPAQFGHIASYLVKTKGFRCTFLSQHPPGHLDGIERVQYLLQGGATQQTHYCSRSLESAIWHSHAVFEALRARPDLKPDLIVAHSGFLTTTFLRELYPCPIVNYFEYFYRTTGSDIDFRPDFPYPEINRLRARARNATLLLDLDCCDQGYSPTQWQHSRLPRNFHDKVRVIFDGVDTKVWHPRPGFPRQIGDWKVPHGIKIVTYVARGMESLRGFDIFMKMAKRICDRRKDVVFVVVGEDRVCYGGDQEVIGNRTFKQWVLAGDDYDLSRFIFTGLIPTNVLAELLAVSDLHVYLTVPFILSWSLMDALACGTTVLASNTAPVREMIEHGRNGLLVDFFDIEGMANLAEQVLNNPQDYRHLGQAGVKMIAERYSLDVCLPQMLELYEDATAALKQNLGGTEGIGVTANREMEATPNTHF
jgi:glycosyltransferase involved in cell wall biosynthesis